MLLKTKKQGTGHFFEADSSLLLPWSPGLTPTLTVSHGPEMSSLIILDGLCEVVTLGIKIYNHGPNPDLCHLSSGRPNE